MTSGAEVSMHYGVVRTVAESPRQAWLIRVERARPVVAVVTNGVETGPIAVASSGQEEAVTVGGCKQATVHAILGRPCIGCVVEKLLPFRLGWHAPIASPVGRGRVVTWFQGGQIVGEAVVAVAGVAAVLGESGVTAVAVLVGVKAIVALR